MKALNFELCWYTHAYYAFLNNVPSADGTFYLVQPLHKTLKGLRTVLVSLPGMWSVSFPYLRQKISHLKIKD